MGFSEAFRKNAQQCLTRAQEAPSPQERGENLCQQIQAAGGWVTSVPGADTLRFEIPELSALPEQLKAAGWRPLHMGTGTRIVPGAVAQTITVHSTGKPFRCRNDGFALRLYRCRCFFWRARSAGTSMSACLKAFETRDLRNMTPGSTARFVLCCH